MSSSDNAKYMQYLTATVLEKYDLEEEVKMYQSLFLVVTSYKPSGVIGGWYVGVTHTGGVKEANIDIK